MGEQDLRNCDNLIWHSSTELQSITNIKMRAGNIKVNLFKGPMTVLCEIFSCAVGNY